AEDGIRGFHVTGVQTCALPISETDLIGLVVERATGRRLAHYLSDVIWKPYGMAAEATWFRDECDGSNTDGSGLSAILGDYARLDIGRASCRESALDAGGRADAK